MTGRRKTDYSALYPEIWDYLYNVRKYSRSDCRLICFIAIRLLEGGYTYQSIVDTDETKLMDYLQNAEGKHYSERYTLFIRRLKDAILIGGVNKLC